jgi:predicted transposase YdaD
MADKAETKARRAVRRAQSDFEQTGDQHERARKARRKAFEQAREAGLSMRDIAKETGLHFTRVAQVLQQKP